MKVAKNLSLSKVLPWILVAGGVIGTLCSAIITIDKFKLLENPAFKPNCDLNPIISCGSVMQSAQSHVFGFSNSLIGLVAFPVLITVGMSILSGAKFKRWYWLGLQLGTILGLIFIHWLAFQTIYRIHALCPYCMVVWVVTITTFWYTLLYNIQEKYIVVKGKWAIAAAFARKHHLDILIFWFLVILALILKQFWYYYGPILGFN